MDEPARNLSPDCYVDISLANQANIQKQMNESLLKKLNAEIKIRVKQMLAASDKAFNNIIELNNSYQP
jgi:hypothetical protein